MNSKPLRSKSPSWCQHNFPEIKSSEVIWGIRDFVSRFGRSPEGMWLPETAVDVQTLEAMAEQGILFTVLAPHQAGRIRKIGEEAWSDVSGGHIDPTMAYLCRLPSGRSIGLFFYDGPISGDIAFGDLLYSGENLANRLISAFSDSRDWPQLVHIATDGETYGHHHNNGDMALAYCLDQIESRQLARVTNYGEYLERHPPTHEVEIVERSSWSCIHGVERWRADCGCHSGMHPQWNQSWRGPLRQAMNRIRDWLAPFFEHEAAKYLKNPWNARDGYIEVVLDRSKAGVEKFLRRHAARQLTPQESNKVLKLMEMQRHSMLAFTSCGWFFDEISGIEGTQVMRYGARALQLAEEVWGVNLESFYREVLEEAPSNLPEYENGATVYDVFVKPSQIDLPRVGAHHAIASVFDGCVEDTRIYCYSAISESFDRHIEGELKLAVGRVKIISDITWDERIISFATLYRGGHDVVSVMKKSMNPQAFNAMSLEMKSAFNGGDVSKVVRLMEKLFDDGRHTLRHLFKDEQTRILNDILKADMESIEEMFREIVERNHSIMNFLNEIRMPIPKPLAITADFSLNAGIQKLLEHDEPDMKALETLIDESGKWAVRLDASALAYVAVKRIDGLMARAAEHPEESGVFLERVEHLFVVLKRLNLELNLWKAQNIYFSLAKEILPAIVAKAGQGDPAATGWVKVFRNLGDHMGAFVG